MLEEHYFTYCNSDSLFIMTDKFCHSFGCCFLKNVSRKLNSVYVVLLVSYSSHLDVLLTACPIFYLNHDKCFLSVWWLTGTAVYCFVHCIVTAVQQCSAHQTRCVCYSISLFVMQFLYKVHNTEYCVLSVYSGALQLVLQIIDIWSPHLKVLKPNFSLDKPSLIPTLHGAQVSLYHFYQKQLIAQNIVIET